MPLGLFSLACQKKGGIKGGPFLNFFICFLDVAMRGLLMPPFSNSSVTRKPLVSFSTRERASLVTQQTPMPKRGRKTGAKTRSQKKATKKKGRRRVAFSNKVRLVGGKLRLRVTGYDGLQSLAPSALVRFIAATKLRLAARKVLRAAGQLPRRKRRNNKRKKTASGK